MISARSGGDVVIQVLPPLLSDQLAAERGFADLTWASEEHHFLSQIGPYTVIKIAVHTAILRLFSSTLSFSRDFTSKY